MIFALPERPAALQRLRHTSCEVRENKSGVFHARMRLQVSHHLPRNRLPYSGRIDCEYIDCAAGAFNNLGKGGLRCAMAIGKLSDPRRSRSELAPLSSPQLHHP